MNEKKHRRVPNVALAIWRFHAACNDLAYHINDTLFDGGRDNWYWVGGEPGGTCDFGGSDFLTPEEMVLILKSGMNYEQYSEWRDANINNVECKGYINLHSWIKGCRHNMLPDKVGNPSLLV